MTTHAETKTVSDWWIVWTLEILICAFACRLYEIVWPYRFLFVQAGDYLVSLWSNSWWFY